MKKPILIFPERFINRSFQQSKSNQTFRDALHTHTDTHTHIHTHTQALLILNGNSFFTELTNFPKVFE